MRKIYKLLKTNKYMVELDPYWEDCLISEEEKEKLIDKYISMLEETTKTCKLLEENARYPWTIISGYYVMYYKTLILLAEKHNLKPHNYESHSQIIHALHILYNKKEIANLLNIAYRKVNFEQLPGNLLYKGKNLRHKVNYMTHPNSQDINKDETKEFLINIKDKFLELIDKLMEDKKDDNQHPKKQPSN